MMPVIERIRERIAWWLVNHSHTFFARPRGGRFGYRMQRLAHGFLGNGWRDAR
jgi:hypothetical protein